MERRKAATITLLATGAVGGTALLVASNLGEQPSEVLSETQQQTNYEIAKTGDNSKAKVTAVATPTKDTRTLVIKTFEQNPANSSNDGLELLRPETNFLGQEIVVMPGRSDSLLYYRPGTVNLGLPSSYIRRMDQQPCAGTDQLNDFLFNNDIRGPQMRAQGADNARLVSVSNVREEFSVDSTIGNTFRTAANTEALTSLRVAPETNFAAGRIGLNESIARYEYSLPSGVTLQGRLVCTCGNEVPGKVEIPVILTPTPVLYTPSPVPSIFVPTFTPTPTEIATATPTATRINTLVPTPTDTPTPVPFFLAPPPPIFVPVPEFVPVEREVYVERIIETNTQTIIERHFENNTTRIIIIEKPAPTPLPTIPVFVRGTDTPVPTVVTAVPTLVETPTPTKTLVPGVTPSPTVPPTATQSATPTEAPTPTAIPTNTDVIPTSTEVTASQTPTPTRTNTPTSTAAPTVDTPLPTVIPTNVHTTMVTATPVESTPTRTKTPTPTARPTVDTPIPTVIPTNVDVPFKTATTAPLPTRVPATPTRTKTPTPTARPTVDTPRPTVMPTNIDAPIRTATTAPLPTSIRGSRKVSFEFDSEEVAAEFLANSSSFEVSDTQTEIKPADEVLIQSEVSGTTNPYDNLAMLMAAGAAIALGLRYRRGKWF